MTKSNLLPQINLLLVVKVNNNLGKWKKKKKKHLTNISGFDHILIYYESLKFNNIPDKRQNIWLIVIFCQALIYYITIKVNNSRDQC